MNAKEVAKLLGLHPNTVYSMIKDGSIRAEKKGRSYDVPQGEVNMLMAEKHHSDVSEINLKAALQLIGDYEVEIQVALSEMVYRAERMLSTLKRDGYFDLKTDKTFDFLLEEYKSPYSSISFLKESFEKIEKSEIMIKELTKKVKDLEENTLEKIQERKRETRAIEERLGLNWGEEDENEDES